MLGKIKLQNMSLIPVMAGVSNLSAWYLCVSTLCAASNTGTLNIGKAAAPRSKSFFRAAPARMRPSKKYRSTSRRPAQLFNLFFPRQI